MCPFDLLAWFTLYFPLNSGAVRFVAQRWVLPPKQSAASGLSDGKKSDRTSHVNNLVLVVFNIQIRIFMALKHTNMQSAVVVPLYLFGCVVNKV